MYLGLPSAEPNENDLFKVFHSFIVSRKAMIYVIYAEMLQS